MTPQALTRSSLFLAVLIALAYPLAAWMARVGDGKPIDGIVGVLERAIYRAAGVDAGRGDALDEICGRAAAVQCARCDRGVPASAPAGLAAA